MIENCLKEKLDFNFTFFDYMFKQEKITKEIKPVIDFLTKKLTFYYGNFEETKIPFVPFATFVTGERSAVFEDLTESDFRYITEILHYTQNRLVKGRLFDILGVHFKDKTYMLNAANEYFNYFLEDINDAKSYNLNGAFMRSMTLFWGANKKEFKNRIHYVFNNIVFKDEDQKLIFFNKAMMLLKKYNQNIKKEHIEIIEDFITTIDEPHEPLLEIIREVAHYYKKTNDVVKAQFWRIRFANICVGADKKYRHGYHFLQKALGVLDPLEDADKINELRFLLEDSQKRMHDAMQFVSVDLDESLVNDIKNGINKFNELFQGLSSGVGQFLCFLKHFKPVSIKEIEQYISIQKGMLTYNYCNNILFDEYGRVIFESSDASETEKEEYDFSQAISQHLPFGAFIIDSWNRYRIIDDGFKEVLRDITQHNLLIPNERSSAVFDIILKGLVSNKIREALFNIIPQFEYGCRCYLKNHCKKYPIIYKGNIAVSIDLNHMLVQKGKSNNENRQELVKIIGDDLILNIEYLACRKMSGNLRNRNYHEGFDNADVYNLNELGLFYFILKAYCMGYDGDV